MNDAEELALASDEDYIDDVAHDLTWTKNPSSPFQSAELRDRTLWALGEKLAHVERTIERKTRDGYTLDEISPANAFRRHILRVMEATQRNIEKAEVGGNKARAWKNLLNELCDELEGSPMEWILDEFDEPFGNLTLREWVEVRRLKDPSRIPEDLGVAA